MAVQSLAVIEVGGRSFPIPPLSARRIMKYSKTLGQISQFNPAKMSEEEMTKVYEALLIGIEQGTPEMTLDALLDMPVTFTMALEALKTVSQQAGMEVPKEGPPEQAGPENPSIPPNSKPNGPTSSPTL